MIPYSAFDASVTVGFEQKYFSSFTLLAQWSKDLRSQNCYLGERSTSSNLLATEHSRKARCGTDSLEKSEAPAAAGLRQLVGALQVKYQLGVTPQRSADGRRATRFLSLAPSAGGYAWIVSACGRGIFVFSLFLSLLVRLGV